jgi:hypothetical protein
MKAVIVKYEDALYTGEEIRELVVKMQQISQDDFRVTI